jgi:hypothetical protein
MSLVLGTGQFETNNLRDRLVCLKFVKDIPPKHFLL